MDPNVILSFNRPVGEMGLKTTDDMLNPQSAFINALRFKNRPISSHHIGNQGSLNWEGPAKRLGLDDNGRIVEVDGSVNNVRLPPEMPQFVLKKSTPQAPLPVEAKPLPLIAIQRKPAKKLKKEFDEPFTFKTGSITRQDDFDVN